MSIHRPKLIFREKLNRRSETKFVVVHHTAVKGRHDVKEVHQWHLNRKCNPPMAGIGYHYYIDKDGKIYEGRPRDTWGAHVKAKGYNGKTIAVCFEGDFNTEKMDEKQLDASVLLLSVLSLGYGNIDICTHHYLHAERTCPGKNFPFKLLIKKVHDQKQRFIDLYGDPKEVDYVFLLKLLE